MNTLSIDTSTNTLGLCLSAGDRIRIQHSVAFDMKHSTQLMPSIINLFSQAGIKARELELVVCAIGPGSFTGLRIGLATAKGLSFGAGCGLVGVPSLDLYGHALNFFPGIVVPVFDARKGRLYAAFYRKGSLKSDIFDLAAGEILDRLAGAGPALFTGPGAPLLAAANQTHSKPVEFEIDPNCFSAYPNALLELGQIEFRKRGGDPVTLSPFYLRESEAEIKKRSQA